MSKSHLIAEQIKKMRPLLKEANPQQKVKLLKLLKSALTEKKHIEESMDLSRIDPEDHGETEGSFTKNQIQTMIRVLSHLENAIGDDEDLPEWVQMLLSQSQEKVVAVMDYMISAKEIEAGQETGNQSIMSELRMMEGKQRVIPNKKKLKESTDFIEEK
jgi:hypothetical protein